MAVFARPHFLHMSLVAIGLLELYLLQFTVLMKGLSKLTVINVICRLSLVLRELQFQTHFETLRDCKLLRRCCQVLEPSGM